MELIETEGRDGASGHNLEMVWPDGARLELEFDAETSLLRAVQTLDHISLVSDYRQVGDLLIAHKRVDTVTLPSGEERTDVDTITDLTLNPHFPDGFFKLPKVSPGSGIGGGVGAWVPILASK